MNDYRLPDDARPIEVIGATVPFYTFSEDELTYYYFDSSMTAVPEPMVNAMAGLRLIDDVNKRLVMINHQPPLGLLPKIEGHFKFEIEHNSEQKAVVIFTYIPNKSEEADLNQTHCDG
ncbi:hypothetical protein [Candidatus Marinarcus aquaticus]|uniref:DUF2249 domain-containing protein n=1 Tax=Candidatus Marinarcus aquaticus TaxID=2044504 RepID=A0A4Q0XPM6_9BACT|nr:hypothetical protein [Candidatus Marinarcus aquaticus]RXJ57679.1 hypothetical protein CRV04_07670 [Candidatus Marinarcus aquaticus]